MRLHAQNCAHDWLVLHAELVASGRSLADPRTAQHLQTRGGSRELRLYHLRSHSS
jgi:hypothetical protein